MKVVSVKKEKPTNQGISRGVTREEFEYRMDMLELKTDQLDQKIARKADDIVSYQLLQHRQELEDLYEAIKQIDLQIKQIERELDRFSNSDVVESVKIPTIKRDNLRFLHT